MLSKSNYTLSQDLERKACTTSSTGKIEKKKTEREISWSTRDICVHIFSFIFAGVLFPFLNLFGFQNKIDRKFVGISMDYGSSKKMHLQIYFNLQVVEIALAA